MTGVVWSAYFLLGMSMNSINEATWPEILKVQSEAYVQVEPEALEVLKAKWLRSPDCCFVYCEGEHVLGYLLAHSWNSDVPPKLYQVLPSGSEGPILFLHDLALSKWAAGKGLGSLMVEHLLKVATALGFERVRLVSIQASDAFWRRFGFLEVADREVCASYGDGAKIMERALMV